MSSDDYEDDNASELTKEYDEKINSALSDVPKSTKADPGTAFLEDFFDKRKWEGTEKTEKLGEDSDDLEEIDEDLEFQEEFNSRAAELSSMDTKQTARQRKRKEESEQAKVHVEEIEKKYAAVDAKYKKIWEENGGKLTKEQLSQYTSEIADIALEEQGEKFEYKQLEIKGGIKEGIRILEDEEDEEDEGKKYKPRAKKRRR